MRAHDCVRARYEVIKDKMIKEHSRGKAAERTDLPRLLTALEDAYSTICGRAIGRTPNETAWDVVFSGGCVD